MLLRDGLLPPARLLLLCSACWLATPAAAVCSNSGTGTVTSPDAGDEISCTGTDSNRDIIISAPGVEVTLGPNASLTDSNITFFGPSQGVVTLETGALLTAPAGTVRAILVADTEVNINAGAVVSGDTYGISSSSNDAAVINLAGRINASSEAIFLGGGDDVVNLMQGASMSGSGIRGGLGNDVVNLSGNGTLTLPVFEFETLNKNGAGIWALESAIDPGTAINVTDGELSILRDGNGQLAGISTTVAQGALLGFDTGTSASLDATASISGAGGIAKDGLGELTIAAPSTGIRDFTGIITVRAGNLSIGDAALYDNALEIAGGSTVNLAASGSHTGNISGAGGLLVSNVLTLAGSKSFTGGIELAANLNVLETASLGSGAISLGGGTRLTINSAIDQTFSNELFRQSAGQIEVLKGGIGNLTVSRSNSNFDGTFTIDSGRVTLANGSAGLGSGQVVNNGEFSILGNVANVISGSGTVIKEGGNNTAQLLASNTYSGGTVINEGAIIGGLTSFGTGLLALNNQSVALLDVDVDGTFANDVNGTGTLFKRRAGTVTLSGAIDVGRFTLAEGNARADAASYRAALTDVGLNSVFELFGNGSITGTVRGDGSLRKTGTGRVAIASTSALEGAIQIDAGTLALSDRTASQVTIASGGTLELNSDTSFVISNSVTGAGQLSKAGDGTVSFSLGAVQHSGGSLISAGTLASSDALGSGAVNIGSAGTWARSVTGLQSLTNALQGSGELALSGNGTLSIDQANTGFTGSANLGGVTVLLDDEEGLGSATLRSDGVLVLDDVNLTNAFSGSGVIRKVGTGESTLSGSNSHSGGIEVQTGTLAADSGSLGSGTISLNTDTTLRLTGGSDSIANALVGGGRVLVGAGQRVELTGQNDVAELDLLGAATVSSASAAAMTSIGSGGELTFSDDSNASGLGLVGTADSRFVKAGSGTLALTSDSTLGAISISGGRLDIDAVVGSAGTQVASDATLGGSGRLLGDVSVGGTMAPGNSIGTLTVDGNYTQQAGSVLEIEFDSAGNIDLLAINGTADIQGGELRLQPLSSDADGVGQTFLTATGGVTGEFDAVSLNGGTGIVTYDPNALAIGENLSMIVLGVRPATVNSQMAVGTQGAVGVLEAIDGPGLTENERLFWGYVVAAGDERDREGDVLGYDADTVGGGFGARLPLSENFYLGLAVADADGEADLNRNAGNTDVDGTYGTVFAGGSLAQLAWQAGVLIGQQDWRSRRVVEFDGAREALGSATDADVFAAYGRLALASRLGEWQLRPEFSLSYVSIESDALVERGNNLLALSIPSLEADTGYARLALSGDRLFALNRDTRVTPHWYAGIERAFPLDDREVTARFVNAALSDPITLDADAKARNQLVLGGQLEVSLGERTALTVAYDLASGDGETRQAARAGLRVRF